MNRRSFLEAASAAMPGVLLAQTLPAASEPSRRVPLPFKVGSGKDRTDAAISLYEGDMFFTKVSGRDCNGALYIYESTRLRQGGPAQHFHYEQDEWISVLEGGFVIKVGETTYEAKP